MIKCCDDFEKLPVSWMLDPKGNRVMPHFVDIDGERFRINYCPICGNYIRDLMSW